MVTVKYGDHSIKHISIDSFSTRSSLIENLKNNMRVKLTIPLIDGYDRLFIRPYKDFTIKIDGIDYLYEVENNPKLSTTEIQIDVTSKLYRSLLSKMSANYAAIAKNPISAVKEILDLNNIDYDNYSFTEAEEYFSTLEAEFEIAYNIYLMDLTIIDFLNEILRRVCCRLVFDIEKGKIYLFNFIRPVKTDDFRVDVFDEKLIDPSSYKETETKIFYNAFNIGIYPILSARSTRSFNYEVDFQNGTDYFNQDILDAPLFADGEPVTLNRDVIVNDVFYASGSVGTFTANDQEYSTALEDATIYKAEQSRAIYGEVSSWDDVKSNVSTGIVKQSNVDGAYRIGNRIIQVAYLKRREIEFDYYQPTYLKVGDYTIFRNKKWYVKDKVFKRDLFIEKYTIEEVLI